MFGQNRKSKRAERQYALDVKARAKPLRAMRLRMALSALAISTGMVFALLVVWKGGDWLLQHYVYTNPSFALDQLEIYTDGIIPPEQLRRWANVRKGDNLLAIDLNRIKRDLELVPLIESASVERYLPRRLVLRVTEREPIAAVLIFQPQRDGMLEPSTFYLDREGMVIPPYARSLNVSAFDLATGSLPNLTGVAADELRPGSKVQRPAVLRGLRWLYEFKRSEMAGRAEIRSIDISAGDTIVVATDQGNEITFANRDFPGQLARWRKIHDFGLRQSRLIASLDLAVTNYVPASWLELTNAPPPLVKPPKESPYRKKHV